MSAARKELYSLICLCVFTVFVSTQHLEPNVQILPLHPVRNLFCESNDDCRACKNPFVWHPSTDTCVLPKAECSTVYKTATSSQHHEEPAFRRLSSNEPGTVSSLCSPRARQCNASVVVEGFCDPNSHYTILQNFIINVTSAKSLSLFLNGRQYIVKASPENLANARFSEMLVEGETIKVSYESMSEKSLELELSMETCCRPHDAAITCGEHCRSCAFSGQDMCDEHGCEEGYEFDSETKTCRIMFNCSEHCTSCTQSGPDLCDENSCENGFTLDSQTKTCEPICSTIDVTNCADHCWSCAISGKNKCDEEACKNGYTLDSRTKTCTPVFTCSEHCTSCTESGPDLCDENSCEEGYKLDNQTKSCKPIWSNFNVIKCGDHCWSCDDSGEGKCDENACKNGYILDSQNESCKPVIKCGEHCWSCNLSGEGKCDENACKYGYMLDSTSQTCKPVSEECDIKLHAWGYHDTIKNVPSSFTIQGKKKSLKVGEQDRGINIMTINPSTCEAYDFHNYDTYYYPHQAKNLAKYLQQLRRNTIIVGVTSDEATASLSQAKQALKDIGVDVSNLKKRGKMAFAARIGHPDNSLVKIVPPGGASLDFQFKLEVSGRFKN